MFIIFIEHTVFTAGKEAMKESPGHFNKEASDSYQALNAVEKESLRAQIPDPVQMMTKREICQKGSKIFKMMQKLV